jgi:hypothetical protein
MTNYVKNYRTKAITKAYDLLELKANGRIDEDGDYLDDEGWKLTHLHSSLIPKGFRVYRVVNLYEHNQEEVIEDGFICVDSSSEKWCVRRDQFLATYEEVK